MEKYITYKVWDEIIHPFPNFNDAIWFHNLLGMLGLWELIHVSKRGTMASTGIVGIKFGTPTLTALEELSSILCNTPLIMPRKNTSRPSTRHRPLRRYAMHIDLVGLVGVCNMMDDGIIAWRVIINSCCHCSLIIYLYSVITCGNIRSTTLHILTISFYLQLYHNKTCTVLLEIYAVVSRFVVFCCDTCCVDHMHIFYT